MVQIIPSVIFTLPSTISKVEKIKSYFLNAFFSPKHMYLVNMLHFYHNLLPTQSSPKFIFQQTHVSATLTVGLKITEVMVPLSLPCYKPVLQLFATISESYLSD